ncbi:MAG TPA: NAD(P)-binding domain-containing protein [Chthoniobacterales bacterium]|jgi:thioredoxin reductase/ferredoxin
MSASFSPVTWLGRYTDWLHTRWPAGEVEPLPEVGEDGSTNIPGLFVVGDLTGIPLLKFAVDSGARVVGKISPANQPDVLDVAIIGGGVSGIAAAVEAKKRGLSFEVFEAAEPFSTIVNFPKGKHIYTYPTGFTPAGDLQISAPLKEGLVDELEAQRKEAGIEPTHARVEKVDRENGLLSIAIADEEARKAHHVIVAIGRSGSFRKLGCPGEDLAKVSNRLHDPKDYAGRNVLVVGGGDSALETAIALTTCGAHTTLSYRKAEFSRPKPENLEKITRLAGDPSAKVGVERPSSDRVTSAASHHTRGGEAPGSLRLKLGSEVAEIGEEDVSLVTDDKSERIPNDFVFTMIGRQPPLDFFRKSGVPIHNEWRVRTYVASILFVVFCVFLYHFKSNHPQEFPVQQWLSKQQAFPFTVGAAIDGLGGQIAAWSKSEGHLFHTLRRGLGNPSFYYTLAYCTCVVVFGIRRMRRRRTPYVTWQTWTLIAVQCIPLFILPEIILPMMGRNGWFEPAQPLRWLADQLFESYDGERGHERAYWRAYGFILAFPLNVYNVFTEHPMWLWLGISFVQTFVIIPLVIWRWGKGAYCGWICSCGALAETLGDAHRQKMPHGSFWNRLNMLGQVVLLFAMLILILRIASWAGIGWAAHWYERLFVGIPFLNYAWSVDILLGGILGVGLYFWFSGRVWCRFACPLAALMHIYTRFSRFRIFPDKSKCISCNVCTSMCHQGIDVMNFANKGLPMEDPQCVRCSACVHSCPTGVLSFGHFDDNRKIVLDRLPASPILMAEGEEPKVS